ncbi:peptidyl-prolyl cis-trans isomerase B (cyclophilin B) [Agrococcus baldri]|uniref:Peptidyl-prolyl cis-trans isomerase B (Cyclophilin B) n=1 Tax=Agrococcus baldri TaxID=153730 RepID=A0AA94HQ46_9MICO|nr:peptidylprolyl isomerase [Agrococcus baldri]SFS18709.1 peptidyl-prolyl cis-trans isomerase B (cyclophilin B) [Agrococcus baldri]
MVTKQEQERRVRDYRARQTVNDRRKRRQTRDSVIGGVLAAVVLFGGIGLVSLVQPPAAPEETAAPAATDPAASEPAAPESEVPDASLAEDRAWTGTLTLNGIDLGVELDASLAPQAVSSVLFDTQRDYYDGKTCHRLTTSEGFSVLQCGSVDGQGSGDPSFMYGPIENAPADDVYVEGTIAMARQGGNADSNGHQFFIVYGDTTIPSDAAGGYTVIGQVTSGLDQLQEQVIANGTVDDQPDGAPAEPVTIDDFVLQ